MSREGRGAGYTLLELLYSMAIIGVVASLSTFMSPLIQRERGVQAVMELRSLLNYTRQSAIIRSQRVTLCAIDKDQRCVRDWDGQQYAIFIDANADRELGAEEEVLRLGYWSGKRGSLRWRASLARPYIEFRKWGQTAQNGSFHFCAPQRLQEHATAVIVNRAGRNYVAQDRNRDGIRETASGKPLSCN